MYKTTLIFGWIAGWTDVVYGTHAQDTCRDREEKRARAENITIAASELTDDGIVRARAQQRDCRGVGIARGAEISMPRGKRSGGVMHTHRVGLDS